MNAVKIAVAETLETFGQLDVIVNNAGYGMGGTVEEFTDEELQQSFTVNVFAPVYVMQAALPFLRKQRSGHIINISSIAGFAGSQRLGHLRCYKIGPHRHDRSTGARPEGPEYTCNGGSAGRFPHGIPYR